MGANNDELIARLGRWSSGRGPLYLLLAVRLRALIDDGELRPGTLLPPDRELARSLAVGRGTVVAAYDLLQQEGRVVRRQGSGTRVCAAQRPLSGPGGTAGTAGTADTTANPLLLHLLDPPENVTLLSCAAPDGPPPVLVEAYLEAAARLGRIRHDIGYHPAGYPELRERIASYHRERGVPTTAGQIMVTNGGQQALTLLANLLLSPGDTVLTEAPTYPGALESFREAAALFRTAADAEAFGAALADRPALGYLVPTCHNPTGAIMPPLVRRRLAALAAEHDVPLVEDEVPAELCFSGETPPPLAYFGDGRRIITVGSLSKLVWGGLRIGWIRAAAPVISRLVRLRAVHDLGGEILGQLAAASLISQMDRLRRDRIDVLRRRHDHLLGELAAKLPSWSAEPALGGQTIWVRLPGDAGAFAQVALRHGVAVPQGRSFDPSGGHGDHLRLPFLFDEETLTASVTALAAAWRDYDGTRRPGTLQALVV
ncbi:PLP-dependent aminotransferase family protein [Streptosporangium sp. NPDC050855]|uniref:aminotransferase-like domain-containing protein n=1 Tax=Streptosporangium sp. NPDC050855 TaxID=3366194 RepID=UPI0037A49255